MVSQLGICQWFHYEDYQAVEKALRLLRELNVRHVRTGVFWADWHRRGGPAWYEWMLRTLHESGLELLVSFWCTPPSLAELLPGERWQSACARELTHRPPQKRYLQYYAEDLRALCQSCGDCICALELWNEPNNRYKWNVRFDPDWQLFAEMVIPAAAVAASFQKPVCLGGMSPCDPNWILNMKQKGVLDAVHVIGIHDFPDMWRSDTVHWATSKTWSGWDARISELAAVDTSHPYWITETGYATTFSISAEGWQCIRMKELAETASVDRAYWYSLLDLDHHREAIEGFHEDEDEYHMGLVTCSGEKKPAFFSLQQILERQAIIEDTSFH